MKELDDRYGRHTYAKHITDFVRHRLYLDDIENLELTNRQKPDIKLMNDDDVKEWVERCLDDE